MNPEKMLELQMQMRQNSGDIQDFLKDLDNWEDQIKEKDEALKVEKKTDQTSENTKANPKNIPPVRNSLNQKRKKKKKRDKKETSEAANKDDVKKTTKKRISGFDFRAWDKFDVDKALDEIESESSLSEESETDDEWEAQRRMQQAIMYKDQGNQLFKEGKYDDAVECYTKGMAADPYNVLLPANRAMALLKQEKYGAAESDCTNAISIDPTYIKAFSRRGAARIALGKLKEAKSDFERVLKLEPNNKQALTEVSRIEKQLNPPTEDLDGDTGMIQAVKKSPSERSKKPLLRMKIEEVGHVQEEQKKLALEKLKSTQSETKKKKVPTATLR